MGAQALSGSRDRTLKLWDLETGRLLDTFTGHKGMVLAVAVSPDGRHALSGSDDSTVKFWDLENGEQLRTFAGQGNVVNSLAISPDRRHGLTGSDDCTLRLWDLETGDLVRIFTGHEHGIGTVSIAADGAPRPFGIRRPHRQTLGSRRQPFVAQHQRTRRPGECSGSKRARPPGSLGFATARSSSGSCRPAGSFTSSSGTKARSTR